MLRSVSSQTAYSSISLANSFAGYYWSCFDCTCYVRSVELGTSTDIQTTYLFNILNSARQHNHIITQGNYKATCFDYRLVIFRPFFVQSSHKLLCTLWDHVVVTSMEYIKLDGLSQRA